MFVARVAIGCYGKGAVLNISLPIIMSLDIILANKMRLVFAAGLWFFYLFTVHCNNHYGFKILFNSPVNLYY